MSDDDVPPQRLYSRTYSRTYSRSRHSTATNAFDEAADKKSVPVKEKMSISKWKHSNYFPVQDSLDGASEPKKVRTESKRYDPFSFDTEDKRRLSPVEKEAATVHEQELHQSTKLPASRIVVKGEGVEEEKGDNAQSQAFHNYPRSSSKTLMIDKCGDDGRNVTSWQSHYPSDVGLTSSQDLQKDEEEDIFHINSKKNPPKTYSKEVVADNKPDSPTQRKSGYQRNLEQRGRKPPSVSEPGLIEQCKQNCAQQLKGRSDPGVKGLNNSTVVSKQEVTNEKQGTTVVVCKSKAQQDIEEIEYIVRDSNSKGRLVPTTSEIPSSQEEMTEENRSTDSTSSTPNSTDTVLRRSSASFKNVSLADSSDRISLSSNGSTNSFSSPSSSKHIIKNSNCIIHSTQSALSSQSSDNNIQTDGSLGNGAKRYRIFKSRTLQVEDLRPPVLKDEVESFPPSSKRDMNPSGASQVLSLRADGVPLSSLDSSLTSYSAECEFQSVNIKPTNPSAARELLVAHIKNIDKYNDSDSISDPENASEGSEPISSQETPSNSQNENSAVAPRRFFKSKKSFSGTSDLHRRIFGNSPQKTPTKATYNARSWNSEREPDMDQEEKSRKISKKEIDDMDVLLIKYSEKGPNMKREVHWPERKYDEAYTSLKVNTTHKELYTVVHNVKQTHEVQELGETQDFMDEVDYLLDSLRNTNSTAIRCLSCLKLASKCISPAFRMHMRAHGTVSKIFSLLHDACSDPSLALSTSAMMFMLSRDRLNMDLDHDSLNLMLKLNEVDAGDNALLDVSSSRDLEKTKQKVKELLAQLQQETHAREIDLSFVSTGNLALESLLSLTSRRAGEWFKEELRSVGGLDHIVDSVGLCEKSLSEDLSQDIHKSLPVLRKLDRCLRVLENISYMNSDNQNYLICYKSAMLLQSCTRTLRLCQFCMPNYKLIECLDENKTLKDLPGYTILACMLGVLRVMLNITNENQLGNLDVAVETSLLETVVRCLTTTLWCAPVEQRFDLAILCLGLLINLVEHRKSNRNIMMNMETQVRYSEKSQPKTMRAIKAVVELFVQREQAAREMEENTDSVLDNSFVSQSSNKSGEWIETDSGIQWITNSMKKAKEEQEKQQKRVVSGTTKGEYVVGEESQSILEDDEETFIKALHKAGKHMENSIVASYAGLLLGSIVIDNKEYAFSVKKLIPNEDFGPMIKLLKKFLNFMSLTTAFGSTDVNGITKVIEVLEAA